ncbi:hypothetical protein MHB44_12310 [Lysinibacillus sp. FSL H8-0500]|uniref:Uncharacterized protein n=1 Tax=Lysinibacillus macroides TaxID=33935 RepID=A0A0N0CWP3_9BACI|nr:hypothetical protein [Lysinibacillus macroides]KOY83451.1 hypothetical protein ADM90_09330 [Lysinibacillus macroides]QPR69322.1 hypothetical protein I6G82_06855 [Lysinibacillus macroides]
MKKHQFTYFLYPFVYFVVVTLNQWRKQDTITWQENITMWIITSVVIYLFLVLWNWSEKPYQWGKKQ